MRSRRDKHVRRVAVIKHQGAGLVPALGFEPERQPPLGVNHIGKPRLEGNRLHAYSVDPCRAQEKIVVESTSTLIDRLSAIGTSIGAAEANSTHVKPPPTAAPARAAEIARKSRRPNMRVMSASIPCLEAARESKLKFTSQVRPNRLKSVDARDQRYRQQFHEAKIFDAVQAPVLTGSIDAALLHALIENIEIGASREVPKAAALDDLRGYRRLVTSIHTKPALHVVITARDFFIFLWAVGSKWRGVGVGRTKHLYRAARSK